MRSIAPRTLIAGGALVAATLVAAACGSAGREVRPGITFYPREEPPPEARTEWEGSWVDVAVYVSRDPDETELWIDEFVIGRIEESLETYRTGNRARVGRLYGGDSGGDADTVGAFLWRYYTSRYGAETLGSARSLQRAAVDVGGNAVLLVHEEIAQGFRGLRGYILRCPTREGVPDCT